LENVSLTHSEEQTAKSYQMSQQVQKLTAPGQMGEVVKVIGLSKNTNASPSGYLLQDRLHTL